MTTLPPYAVHWQPAGAATTAAEAYDDRYPVPLVDGSTLTLPLRALPGGEKAIALLMSNQTSFEVEAALAPLLTELARGYGAEAVAAMPTMGLDYARLVARGLGHAQYAALGLSRKFWYDEALSEPLSSSTSPDQRKRVYLDPALVERVAGRRVLLVDDVINTGTSAAAALRLLQRAGAQVVGLVVTLTEGHAWREVLAGFGTDWPKRVKAAGHIPLFDRRADGRWVPDAATL